MITLAFVAMALLATALPGAPAALEFDRAALLRGEVWRPLTGQLTHWSWPMALADLAVITAAGLWIERRSQRLLLAGLGASLFAVAVAVAFFTHLTHYRGSSGVAMALAALAATDLARRGSRLGWAVLLLLAAKVIVETALGHSIFVSTIPSGIGLAVAAHVAGFVAGVVVALIPPLRTR